MRHVRPLRLVLTASLTAGAVAIALYPRQAPEPAARTVVPTAPTESLVATADSPVPATPDARVAIERALLPSKGVGGEIPAAALAAYQRAASVAAKVDEDCGITWTLLAAIGGIESDHGRHGSSVLGDDGVSVPLIRGVALDGHGRVAKVADTDAGQVDGDRKWDRAVGPMQFLPATWATVGVDADGDGTRSADDLDDAALGAAVYLCAVPGDLTDRAGLRAAIRRYNPSDVYVDRVIALEGEYRTGAYALPEVTGVSAVVVRAARQPYTIQSDQSADGPTPGNHESDHPGNDPGSGQGDDHGNDPGDDDGKSGSIRDWPDQHPHPTVDPTPTPTPEPEPVVEELTGVLTDCTDTEAAGSTEVTWCLDETVLDLGDADHLAAAALADFDGDAVVETNAEELAGLAGAEVTLTVERRADAAPLVLAIGDAAYVAETTAP